MVNLIDRLLAHSRTIQLMYMAKDIVRDCTLRCKVEDAAKEMVPAIQATALELVKTYRTVKLAYSDEITQKEVVIPELEGLSKEEQAKLKADLSRVISVIDKNTSQ